jgi:hypothetical protein
MIDLNGLNELIFGSNGFHLNTEHPYNLKYWKSEIDKYLEKCQKNNLRSRFYFQDLKIQSNSSILLKYIQDDYLNEIIKGNRYLYYSLAIREECSIILQNISGEIRNGKHEIIVSAVKALRWYVFEISNLLEYYYEPYEDSLDYTRYIEDRDPNDPVDDHRGTSNFVIALYCRDYVINLLHYVSLINDSVNISQNDEYINQTLLDIGLYDGSPYRLHWDYLHQYLKECTPKSLPNHYRILKEIYYRIFKTNPTAYSNSDEKDVLNDIETVETLIYLTVFNEGYIDLNSDILFFTDKKYDPREKLWNQQSVFDELFANYINEIENFPLPIQRINIIDNTIQSIQHLLEDKYTKSEVPFNESIPRRLIKYLTLYSDTIRANPLIDVKVLDQARIKPIKTKFSVHQLAYLFKIFEESKLLGVEERVEYYKTITSVFSTPKAAQISVDSFANKYNSKDDHSVREFWKDTFFSLAKDLKFSK